MFTSITSSCFRKCLAHQRRSIPIMNKFIAESTKMQCHQILYRRRELPSTENGKLVLGCWGRGNIHTSCIQYGSKNLLKKFANKSKKKLWYESPTFSPKQILPSSQTDPLQLTKPKKLKQESTMRMRVLNTILFKAISDFLSSHEVSAEVYNLNVEISKVSLPADFSNCRVYWKTSGTSERDSLIQEVLDKSALPLRHLLISHQVLGSVPPLVFLRDKQYAALIEVEHLLKIADFGEEENTEETKNSNNVKDGGESAHLSNTSGQPVTAKKAPPFGIDHEALNKQILEYKQRPKEALCKNPVPSVTQQQLDVLAELRRQKLIEKKKKSRRPVDDDITPQAYLLARYNQDTDAEEVEHPEFDDEESQVKEVMAGDDRRS
ncbi:hypothetical protein SKAU_G00219080 [Synaphobranchus kaupii]|uniref:Ribosome-binding factor A, mitochondrial n=1 Tax=Synaphobranchus kaupii TaxID=118154 RepID=A0A9Q1FAE1_SYNKA|nr:hypothetical protein SKAU_G00219080 [Synaphobranchus kaupii]